MSDSAQMGHVEPLLGVPYYQPPRLPILTVAMPPQLRPFPSTAHPDATKKLPPSDIESRVRRVLAQPKPAFTPTGLTRESYLDLAEQIIRTAAPWQNDKGAIIDPVAHEELGQTSPRFVSSAAILLSHGRIPDLKEKVFLGMDWCCRRLTSGQAKSPDFWTRELMTAWFALRKVEVPAPRRDAWEKDIRDLEPEKIYWQVEKPDHPIEKLHNWTVYAAAGEGLRQLAGLAPQGDFVWGAKFWDKYMPYQLAHFSEHGMYRDPGDPFTYDMTTRLQFATPLAYGLETPLRPILEEILRRGALAQLLYVSPEGFAPFGGRSNSMHLQEAILAALGELEARRYAAADKPLAGAFKRQAHLGIRSIRRWFEMQPHRHLKNGFPPEQLHGCEDYAGYAVYSLFTASCLVLAAEFADESIPEAVTAAEIGGYVFELKPAFHKIFAACGGTQIEIDTAADTHYDATGLGRFLVAGAPYELGLASPICKAPKYRIPEKLRPNVSMAIGLSFPGQDERWISLASLSDSLKSTTTVEKAETDEVRFSVKWAHAVSKAEVTEEYVLRPGRLSLTAKATIAGRPAKSVRLTVPLLETDGNSTSSISKATGWARVKYRGSVLEVHFAESAKVSFGEAVANRQGIYWPLVLEFESAEVQLDLAMTAG